MVANGWKPDRGFRLINRLIYSTLKKFNSLCTMVLLIYEYFQVGG